jgi:hypothetical protein
MSPAERGVMQNTEILNHRSVFSLALTLMVEAQRPS